MKHSRRALRFALCLALSVAAYPQQRNPLSSGITLIVHVVTEDDRPLPSDVKVKVRLMNTAEIGMFQEGFSDSSGQTRMTGISQGNYKVEVSGIGITTVVSSPFYLNNNEFQHTEIVYVKRVRSAQEGSDPTTGTVSAAEMNIPKPAKKEFEKGAEAMDKGSPDARKHFERALELYPQYAAALNNLGVLSMQEKNPAIAKDFFQRAITVDPHLANAQLNMARLAMQAGDLKQTQQFAQHAVDDDSSNLEALLLLANAELSNGDPTAAIANVRKLHEVPHQQFAVAHLISARAFEMQHKTQDAIIEYRTFLREAPGHPSATKAQAAIDRLAATYRDQ